MIVQACVAAMEGDAQAVAAWLDEGGSVDARCAEQDVTLLMTAAGCGVAWHLTQALCQS